MQLRPSPSAQAPAPRAPGASGRRFGSSCPSAGGRGRALLIHLLLLLLCLAAPSARAEGEATAPTATAPTATASEPSEVASAVWWIARGGEALGPYSEADLDELAHTAELTPRTFVWRDGMAGWARLEQVGELATILRIVQIAALLHGTWEVKGPIAAASGKETETLHVTLRLNFRRDGTFAWSDTAYRPANGQTGSSFHSGPYFIEPRDEAAFRLLLQREDVDSDWEVRILSADRLEVITLGLEARRL